MDRGFTHQELYLPYPGKAQILANEVLPSRFANEVLHTHRR